MTLGQWSTTAANNATADPSINWQEGQAPSTVNDSARAMMAALATWFQAAEWLNYALTPTYVSGTSFTVAGNQTAIYSVGRRVRTFNTGGIVYGTISASVYTTLTTVTITPDSGSLDSGLSEADVGILNQSSPIAQAVRSASPTIMNSGSGTYTTPTGAKILWLRRVGGGGGGASSGVGASNGSAGGATTFGALPSVGGGLGGIVGGAGGTGGLSVGNDVNISGQQGSSGIPSTVANFPGGNGGSTSFGGAGVGNISGNGTNAQANSGSGGAGAGAVSGSVGSSGGGGAGGYAENWIINPAASYTYSVGAGGLGSSSGAAFAGGTGGNGQIIAVAFV